VKLARFIAPIAFLIALLALTPSAGARQIPPELLQPAQTQPATQPTQTQTPPPSSGVGDLAEMAQRRFENLQFEQLYDPQFWLGFTKDAIYWAVGFVPRLLVALFLLLFFWIIYRVVRRVVIGGMRAAGVDESIAEMLGMILKWFIVGFGLIIAGNQVGIQIAALLTGVSIIGLAVGFAAQESLANFIAGILIFWDKPFKIGDWVVVDDHLGQVKRVTFRSTRLEDLDGDVVVFPNVKMLSEKVVNKSTNVVTRCNVAVGIAYKESIAKARDVLLKLVSADPRIEKTPEPEVIVKTLGASSVDLMLHFWIREEKYEDAMQYEYTERAKVALDEAGIEIPFPHVQLVQPAAT
jgi:small conductance mechanosensitive channel